MKCLYCRSELPKPNDLHTVRCIDCGMEYAGDLLREADPQDWAAVLAEDGYRLELHDTKPPTATIYTVAS